MLREEVLSIPESVCPSKTYTLSRRIAALRLTVGTDSRRGRLGDILQLEPGARLDCCGDGYDERTIKVCFAGEFYFVFLRDLYDSESSHS
jgi:hypothetical protein